VAAQLKQMQVLLQLIILHQQRKFQDTQMFHNGSQLTQLQLQEHQEVLLDQVVVFGSKQLHQTLVLM